MERRCWHQGWKGLFKLGEITKTRESVAFTLNMRRSLRQIPQHFDRLGGLRWLGNANPHPLPLRVAKAGRNHLNEEITPPPPHWDTREI